MKHSALIRIFAWGLAVVCLTAILLAGLGLRTYRSPTVFDRTSSVEATHIPIPTADLADLMETAIVQQTATVYYAPSTDEGVQITGMLDAGSEVTIQRREDINNRQWLFINAPISGWILEDTLNAPGVAYTKPAAAPVATQPAVLEQKGIFIPTDDNVRTISIDWYAGNICITAGDTDKICIQETDGDQPLSWKLKAGKLSIDFSHDSQRTVFGLNSAKAKDLTITVPWDWICQELDIDAASSDMVFQDLTVKEAEIDAASGRTEFLNCTVDTLDMDTASGDVYFVGSLTTLECDAASAKFTATLTNAPRSIEMSSASGSMDLTLPPDTGFTVRMEGLSSIFSADDFAIRKQNGTYIHGDGSCRIEMESMSGVLTIHKGETA